MISNGLFALNLKTIFLNNHSIIRYQGDESTIWQREARYDFTYRGCGVAIRFSAGALPAWRPCAAPSGPIPKRTIFAAWSSTPNEIPPELLYAISPPPSTTIAYASARATSCCRRPPILRTADMDGVENRNLVEFTHCQGFRTESTLVFGAARDAAPPRVRPHRRVSRPPRKARLPPALRIVIALGAPLNDHAAVGSLIQGKVVGAVMQKEKVLVPDGALVTGRIRRVERYFRCRRLFHRGVGIHPPRNPRRRLALLRRTCRISTAATAPRWCSAAHARWSRAGSGPRHRTTPTASGSGRTKVPGVGTFFVRGFSLSLPSGFKTIWKTQLYPLPAARKSKTPPARRLFRLGVLRPAPQAVSARRAA